MSVKITSLELENVKRVKAVALTPDPNGLTVIGGKNGQGKTSVLDAIAWALGGERYRPSSPEREGSVVPPRLHIELSNGIVVERKGKNGALTVLDPSGKRAGQQLLNEFISAFALDLPKFMAGSNKEKAETLLQILGIGPELARLDQKEQELYFSRRAAGQQYDRKRKYANGKLYGYIRPDFRPAEGGRLRPRGDREIDLPFEIPGPAFYRHRGLDQ